VYLIFIDFKPSIGVKSMLIYCTVYHIDAKVMNFVQVLANGNLVFPPFRAEDYRQEVHAQVYVCLAKNSVGSIHSRDVNVRAGGSLTVTVILLAISV
jgi:hypothetical protein